MIQRYLLLWLSLSSLLAFCWPDPFLPTKGALSFIFAVAMFSIGSLLPRDEFIHSLRTWPTVVLGTVVQYTVMPLLAWWLVSIYQFSPGMEVGILLTGCVPGAMASNILTHKAGGNVSYSISLTTSATLLSPFVVPWVLYLVLGAEISFDPISVFIKLLWTVVGPVLLGHFLSRNSKVVGEAMAKLGVPLANLAILWIVATVVALKRDQLESMSLMLLLMLLGLNLAGYLSGYTAGKSLRLTEAQSRALTLEVGMQNAGLGAILATSHFEQFPEAAIAPTAYTFGCMLTGTILAQIWSSKSNPPKKPTPKNGYTG